MQLKTLLQNEIVDFPHLIPMAYYLSPITLIKLFLFFLTYYSGFSFQFEVYIIYCLYAQCVFDLVLDVLIVVYTPN